MQAAGLLRHVRVLRLERNRSQANLQAGTLLLLLSRIAAVS